MGSGTVEHNLNSVNVGRCQRGLAKSLLLKNIAQLVGSSSRKALINSLWDEPRTPLLQAVLEEI